jgi:hypothetical protein
MLEEIDSLCEIKILTIPDRRKSDTPRRYKLFRSG